MKKYKNYTLTQYLKALGAKTPVPGGGSVAALTGALAVGLLSMTVGYSLGKSGCKGIGSKLKKTQRKLATLRARLLQNVDRDAQGYLKVVAARKKSLSQQRQARAQALKIPHQTCHLCYAALQVTPFLVRYGNRYLLSDVEVAVELLFAAFKSAAINVAVNQR